MKTPESAAASFLSAWRKQRWSTMRDTLQARERRRTKASRLAAIFGTRQLLGFEILGAKPRTQAASLVAKDGRRHWYQPESVAVYVEITYRFVPTHELRKRGVVLVAVREGPDGMPATGDGPAGWGINPTSAMREVPA